MKVELLHSTPLDIADKAISKCWDKKSDCDVVNVKRMLRVANEFKHSSTIEHLTYNFDIDGISRATLQELARHRIASYSVKSSRYTLAELKVADNLSDFLVQTDNDIVNRVNLCTLSGVKDILNQGVSNDIAKFALPEAYKTSLVWTINARSLQNFLHLRTDKRALWEIRDLAYSVYEAIPSDHKFLFSDYLYKVTDNG